jgi:hypothetical protein
VLQVHDGTVQSLALFYFKLNLVDKGSQVRLILISSVARKMTVELANLFILDLFMSREDGVR